jgi:hypothetical protein
MSKLESIEKSSNEDEIDGNRGKIPKSVPYVIANIFFERFCTAGVLGKKCQKI